MINEYTRKDLDFADIEKIVEGANRVDIDCGKYQIIFKKIINTYIKVLNCCMIFTTLLYINKEAYNDHYGK